MRPQRGNDHNYEREAISVRLITSREYLKVKMMDVVMHVKYLC